MYTHLWSDIYNGTPVSQVSDFIVTRVLPFVHRENLKRKYVHINNRKY